MIDVLAGRGRTEEYSAVGTRMHITQPFDPYSGIKNLSHYTKDYARFFIRSTNQYAAL
jgi:hypothetical protein